MRADGSRRVCRSSTGLARTSHRLRAPRRGARFSARVRASAGVLLNRAYRRNPPPMPVRAAALAVGGDRRGASCIPQIPYFAEPEEAGGHWSPLQNRGEIGAQRLCLNHSKIRSICTTCLPSLCRGGHRSPALHPLHKHNKKRTSVKQKTPAFAQTFIRRERPSL